MIRRQGYWCSDKLSMITRARPSRVLYMVLAVEQCLQSIRHHVLFVIVWLDPKSLEHTGRRRLQMPSSRGDV